MNKPTNEVSKGKRILVQENLFVEPSSLSDKPRLIASKCKVCGEVVFPKQKGCPNCSSEDVQEALIGPKGKLYSFTNVNHPVPEGYKGPIPFGAGLVEMPEGAIVKAYLTESDPKKLKVGMDLVLIIDKLFTDEQGNDVVGFKFKPA